MVLVKSPPALVQRLVLKKRNSQVASLLAAGAPRPPPPLPSALEVLSPQSASSRCSSMVSAPACVWDTCKLRLTLLIVAPAGMLPAMLNSMTPRRMEAWLVTPTKKFAPAPLLVSPVVLSYSVLSLLGVRMTVVGTTRGSSCSSRKGKERRVGPVDRCGRVLGLLFWDERSWLV